MQLNIKPSGANIYPLNGVLIKGETPAVWIRELQRMKLTLDGIRVYPLPGAVPNSLWGCCVDLLNEQRIADIGLNEYCQSIGQRLFIPEYTVLTPKLSAKEIEQFFGSSLHILHPEFGLAELTEEVQWPDLVHNVDIRTVHISKPADSVYVPMQVHSFQKGSITPQEAIKDLEERVFPKPQKFSDKPLDPIEKGKLLVYKLLFDSGQSGKDSGQAGKDGRAKESQPGNFITWLSGFFKNGEGWMSSLQQDYEDLERRNRKQVDKLLDMFKHNPHEALKYAIPLDEKGVSRGRPTKGRFTLSKRWADFTLFQSSGSGRAVTIDLGDHFGELQQQYHTTAEELVKQREYKKAAFIYMKLLRNHYRAAQVLETGKMYQEAASVYLKYTNNMTQAAECYEKGHYYAEAIELYKELVRHEKVGDLYLQIHNAKEAHKYFEIVADGYTKKNQFVKASLIYRNKMNDAHKGQAKLLEGWRSDIDAFNCLNNYFRNIADPQAAWEEIQRIYQTDVGPNNNATFLKVMQYEYRKKHAHAKDIRNLAYEIIAAAIKTNPDIASEVMAFNDKDRELVKDAVKFKKSGGRHGGKRKRR